MDFADEGKAAGKSLNHIINQYASRRMRLLEVALSRPLTKDEQRKFQAAFLDQIIEGFL